MPLWCALNGICAQFDAYIVRLLVGWGVTESRKVTASCAGSTSCVDRTFEQLQDSLRGFRALRHAWADFED